jgi:3-hydroxy-5-methyl-1-naphthoate 3-O-methyltransferase
MSASEASHQSGQPRPLSPERISAMAWGFSAPLILEAAVRTQVFDVLDSGPKTLNELSAATKTSHRGLRAILNALAGFDLLRRDGDRYGLTDESAAFLVSSKPSFQGGIFRHISKHLMPAWLDLEQVVRTGKPDHAVNQEGFGAEFFEQFVEDILPMSYKAAEVLANTLGDQLKPAAGAEAVKVLDIASGSGVWGIALAQKSTAVHVTAVDWPKVTPITRKIAGRFGVGDRFHTVDGDLLEADFGTGHRVATLGHILHSEGEERSRKLLKKVFGALASGGTVAIAEFVADDDRTGPPPALMFAVNMLVHTDLGDTFTFREISGWLTDAGFEEARQLDAPSVSPLILATKPKFA